MILFFDLPETDILSKSNTKISQKKEMDNINKENSIKLEKVLEEYGVSWKNYWLQNWSNSYII